MSERRDKLMLKTVRDVEVRADEEALEKSLYAFRYVAVIVTIIFVLKMKENQGGMMKKMGLEDGS